MCLLQIFPPICVMSSNSLAVDFCGPEVFILMKSSLSIISFMNFAFYAVFKMLLPYLDCLLVFILGDLWF